MRKKVKIILSVIVLSLSVIIIFQMIKKSNMPGRDRDKFGCLQSAGYQWCFATNQCERPSKLAEVKGFEDSLEAFDKFCNKP